MITYDEIKELVRTRNYSVLNTALSAAYDEFSASTTDPDEAMFQFLNTDGEHILDFAITNPPAAASASSSVTLFNGRNRSLTSQTFAIGESDGLLETLQVLLKYHAHPFYLGHTGGAVNTTALYKFLVRAMNYFYPNIETPGRLLQKELYVDILDAMLNSDVLLTHSDARSLHRLSTYITDQIELFGGRKDPQKTVPNIYILGALESFKQELDAHIAGVSTNTPAVV